MGFMQDNRNFVDVDDSDMSCDHVYEDAYRLYSEYWRTIYEENYL